MVYGLTEQDFDRLRRMIKWFEGRPPDRAHDPGGQVPNWQHVRITGPAVGEGSGSGAEGSGPDADDGDHRYWPAVIEVWDAQANVAVTFATIWVLDRNDYDLEVGSVYTARESGRKRVDWNSRSLFIHGNGRSYPHFADDDGSGSGSGSGDGCVTTPPSDTNTLRIPDGCNADGSQKYSCLTLKSATPIQMSLCNNDCDEGSGS